MASIIKSDNGVSSGITGIVQSADSSGQLALQTTTSSGTATTAVTVDNAQNVGVGVTPSAWNSAVKALQVNNAALSSFTSGGNVQTWLTNNAYYDAGSWKYKVSSVGANQYSQVYDGSHAWFTAPSGTAGNAITFTQAMTLDASGNLLVGTTSLIGSVAGISVASAGANVQTLTTNNTSSSAYYIGRFYSGGVEKGYIYYNGSNVAFTSTSDYRLKEDVQPMTGALEKVAQLKPCTYTWKSNGEAGQGFIAHELQAVVPDCVIGEKDSVDAEGNPKYQGIDTSFLVATLTAAIQELSAQVTTLQTQVTALKG